MLPRHAISDADWGRARPLLPRGPAEDDCLFLDAVLRVTRAGAAWRGPPRRFGNWNSAWRGFGRWARAGVWTRVFAELGDEDVEQLLPDPTVVRAHPCAAGARKGDGSGGQCEQELGQGCGGFGTEVHAAVRGLGLPVRIVLSAAQEADVTHAPPLLEGLSPGVVARDKGYDCNALAEAIEAAGVKAVVPSRKNRKAQRAIDRERDLAERFWVAR